MPINNNTQKIFTSRVKIPASNYIGESGHLFYHEDTGQIRLSDGVTPGGLPIFVATVNSNVGSYGDSSHVASFTVTGTGLVTAAANILITPASIGAVSNAGNTPSIQAGTFAALPVANTVGRLYVTTDTNFIYRDNGSTWAALVTNLVLTAPSIFTVTGSPIIGSGTLGLALVPQAQNTVFSGPTAGVNAIPTFRTLGLVTNDISDVTVTTPGPNQILVYNGTKWVNTLANATLLRTWSRTFPVSSGTTIITPGAVAPLITAGTVIASQVITPISVASIYDMHFTLAGDTSANNVTLTAAIFRTVGGVSTYIGASIGVVAKVGSVVTLAVTLRDIPNTTSAVTYTVIFGTSSATWYLNRRVSEVTYGGLTSGLLITER